MTRVSQTRPKAESEVTPTTATPDPTIQERIDAIIAEAVRNAPPALSVEEQRKRNQGAIDLLNQWREEDATDDPQEIAQRQAEWQEFKQGMNENSLSGRVIYPEQDYP